jgi:phosphoribosylaminoimidazole-succinocarboxamide synthase
MLPLECVARGYIDGSAWDEYSNSGTIGGRRFPAGLQRYDRLPQPTFTVALKRSTTDQNVTVEQAQRLFGKRLIDTVEEMTLRLYEHAAAYALGQGIIIADTKLEYGWDSAGILRLGDEVFTPDSSRFWIAETWHRGRTPVELGRAPIRSWLRERGWVRGNPIPRIPAQVLDETSRRYRVAYETLIGHPLEDWIPSNVKPLPTWSEGEYQSEGADVGDRRQEEPNKWHSDSSHSLD